MMIRVLTYNVHGCRGSDGRTAPERIADIIASSGADIVALQEVDVGRRRSGLHDQAALIAERLGMRGFFHPSLKIGDEQYGNAVLTAFPSRVVRAENLPGIAWLPNLEPRSALWVEIHAGEVQLQLFNTHLGLTPMERHIQTQALLGRRWMNGTHHTGPKILAGDFNVVQGSSTYARLTAHLKDSRTMAGCATSSATYPSAWPRVGIDHIFVDHSLSVTSLRAMTTPLCRIASDHLPLLAEISVSPR